jgi:hypothetical protein
MAAKADGFTGEGFMVQTVPSATHVAGVQATLVACITDGNSKLPRLINSPDSLASATRVADVTDGSLMLPRLRGKSGGEYNLAQMF